MTSSLLAEVAAERPRVHSVPPYTTSAGEDAIDLAAEAGLILDPWQRQVLVDSLGERPDGKWAAFEVGVIVPRQNGKGAILEARELAGLVLFQEALILHSAHEVKTAMEAFRRILALLEGSPELSRMITRVTHTNGHEGIELRNGSRLRFLARSKGSGRGFSGDCVILDEAYALTDQQLEALMPTMSARPNPQIWYTSSPSLDAVSGAALMAVRDRGARGEPGLAYFDYGCPRGTNLDDRAEWRRANPAFGIRIFEDFIERERAAMGDEGFARERLGIWPIDASTQWLVIPEDEWTSAAGEWAAHSSPVAFAAEVAMDRSFGAVAVATRRSDGLRQVQIAALEPGTAWMVPWLVERMKRWKACGLVIDAGGPAGSLIADLEKHRVEVLKPSTREYAAACGALVDGVAGPVRDDQAVAEVRDVRHTGQQQLTAAIAALTSRRVAETSVFERAGDGYLASAAALALWGHTVKAPSLAKVVNIW